MQKSILKIILLLTALGLLASFMQVALGADGWTTSLVSTATDGTLGDRVSADALVADNVPIVVYESYATNLVPGDTNGMTDIFVTDASTGITERVSIATDGGQGNDNSYNPDISGDGRIVVFQSRANSLVSGDTNSRYDIFVHDRLTGDTERISTSNSGTEGNGGSYHPVISSDGRYVAFESDASNLVSGDTNSWKDIFVYDLQNDTSELVSVASDGTLGNGTSGKPAISDDGRYVAFESMASTLVSGDTNSVRDIFVHDRQTGNTERVSIATNGTESNNYSDAAAISGDGRYVVYHSRGTNLVNGDTNAYQDIFIRDRQAGSTERVSLSWDGSQGNAGSFYPAVSGDGRFVIFESHATNLVLEDTNNVKDIFLVDRQTGSISRISTATDGTEANEHSTYPTISANGIYVVFESDASNLVPEDSNGRKDVFLVSAPLQNIEIYIPLLIR